MVANGRGKAMSSGNGVKTGCTQDAHRARRYEPLREPVGKVAGPSPIPGRPCLDDDVGEIHEQGLDTKCSAARLTTTPPATILVRVHASMLRKRLEQYFGAKVRENRHPGDPQGQLRAGLPRSSRKQKLASFRSRRAYRRLAAVVAAILSPGPRLLHAVSSAPPVRQKNALAPSSPSPTRAVVLVPGVSSRSADRYSPG